jgi:hypothetical protein
LSGRNEASINKNFIKGRSLSDQDLLPEGQQILMVISHDVDSHGDWVPSETKTFDKPEDVLER